ncbi:MAG: hypothetical protein ACRDOE_13695 [Streptosporangiaceae bacterium]
MDNTVELGATRPDRHHEQADPRVAGQLQAQRGEPPRRRQPGDGRHDDTRRDEGDAGQPGDGVDERGVPGEPGEY